MPRFNPLNANSRIEPMIITMEIPYVTGRIEMKSIFGVRLKNSMCVALLADRQRRQTLASTPDQIDEYAAAHDRREQGREDAEHERDRETFDRAGAEHEQCNTRDHRRDVGIRDRGEGLVEAGVYGSLRRVAVAQLLSNAL